MNSSAAENDIPLVSVVILAHNRAGPLHTVLDQITTALDYPPDRLDIIVVDNASEDGTAAMVRNRYPGIQLLVNEKNLGAPGWNRGFEGARGAYILILDDDCYMTGDALKKAVRAARQYKADLVSFTVRTTQNDDTTFNEQYPTGLLSFWGCSALLSRTALERLDGYDANLFLWANELEFTMRLLDAGLRHLHLPEVASIHMKDPSVATRYRFHQHRLNTRNFAYIAAKLLQPFDMVRAVLNLTTGLFLTALRHPRAVYVFPALLEGVWRGYRNRQPMRSEVSALYVHHTVAFVNTIPFKLRLQSWESFYEKRPQYYPSDTRVISV